MPTTPLFVGINNTTMFELTIIKSGLRTDGSFWFVGTTSKKTPEGFITQGDAYIFGHVEDKFPKLSTHKIPKDVCKKLEPK